MLQKVLPEAKCLCYRAARGIVRTRYVGVHLAKPYVYVHGEVKYPLAGLGDIVDVVRDMIRGEKLRGVEAEGLLPCAVRADELCGVGRNAPLEKFGRLRRIVSCRADKSRLVFDLDADNAAVRVIAGYVSAQLAERAHVGFFRLLAGRRKSPYLRAVIRLSPEEALLLQLDPLGDIVGVSVLPRSKPEDNEPQTAAPCKLHKHVYLRKVVSSLLLFKEFPVDGRGNGIESKSHAGLKGLFRERGVGACGVIQLSADGEKRLSAYMKK